MIKRRQILLALFLTFALLLPAIGFAEGEIVDQSCEPKGAASSNTTIIFDLPMGQSFTPAKSPLAGVEIYLSTANLSGDDTVTLNIRENSITGTILATSSQTVPQNDTNWEGWVYFGFPSELTVTPGAIYVWELVVTENTFAYYATSYTDQYAGGALITKGYIQENQDAYFRTYTYPENSPPVITTQPTDNQALEGQTVSFTAAASGFPVPTVQWERSTDGIEFFAIEGAVLPTYSFTAGVVDDAACYRAVFTNDLGSVTTNAGTLHVTPKFGDRYYQVVQKETPLTWSQAKRAASAMKAKVDGVTYIGHLVTITTLEEYEHVNTLLGTEGPAFIGATRTRKGWTWITGEAWGETYWAQYEPSDGDAYAFTAGGEWDAVSKSFTLDTFLVEYEVKGTRY